jgi:hypothetical protein
LQLTNIKNRTQKRDKNLAMMMMMMMMIIIITLNVWLLKLTIQSLYVSVTRKYNKKKIEIMLTYSAVIREVPIPLRIMPLSVLKLVVITGVICRRQSHICSLLLSYISSSCEVGVSV